MASKALTFLPSIFQTDTNNKFLSATLDQLISEPNLTKIYGYVGRTFAPTYKSTDSYIQELTPERQIYQLEPSVVVTDISKEVTFFASYVDLLNKVKFYGGLTNNHNRLFENEYYSFDPLIDYDKFVNFGQYYWLINGPDSVSVFTGSVENQKTFSIVRNATTNTYSFTSAIAYNPTIILARGGTYTFNVNQPGSPFWIQSELGINGLLNAAPTISVRDVLGVVNNGADSGQVVFTVPLKSAQDRFSNMPIIANVDFTTALRYSDIQSKLASEIFATHTGFDGITSQLDGKTFVFVDQDKIIITPNTDPVDPNQYEAAWTVKGLFNTAEWDEAPWNAGPDIWDKAEFDLGITVPDTDRVAIWQIKLIPTSKYLTFSGLVTVNKGDRIIQTLSGASAIAQESVVNSNSVMVHYENAQIFITGAGPVRIENESQTVYPISSAVNDYLIRIFNTGLDGAVRHIALDTQVHIKSGVTNANKNYYTDYDQILHQVPLLSSISDTLYYQDGTNSKIYGEIKLIDANNWTIDVAREIIGKKNYVSPNGVVFTNGLKVKFELDVTDVFYQNTEFYVEGVGKSITLTLVSNLQTPENYHNEVVLIYNGAVVADYILINRGSVDLNPWSRNNRWFHRDVITATAKYNNPLTPAIFDQTLRAVRPIIEFEPNIQLFNSGKIGKASVDNIELARIDAFNDVQGHSIFGAFGISLYAGMRVIFANDVDPLVRNKIYIVNLISTTGYDEMGVALGPTQINLIVAADGSVQAGDTVVITSGVHAGQSWLFNGVEWSTAQQKTQLNQDPLFDVFDANGDSYSITTSFLGTKIFGYARPASGVVDTVLKFPLSYRNFSTQGEIEFNNYFDTDLIAIAGHTINVNSGVLHQRIDKAVVQRNVWATVIEASKQYQITSHIYDGIHNTFDILVDTLTAETTIPYIKVYKNSIRMSTTMWSKTDLVITINTVLTAGDTIDILVFSNTVAATESYQIPLNLDFNAQNIDFTSLTLGQMRNHVIELANNSNEVTGDIIGINNLRDLQFKQQGGNILQHSAPVPYASLFLIDNDTNFINSLQLAQHEYSKFKNKFLEASINLPGINGNDPAGSVDLILSTINGFKNSTFPWCYSDMVPYGTRKNIIDIVVFDPSNRSYELTNIFNDTILSNNAVLVYLNSDPTATYIDGTGINVEFDIVNKLQYVTPGGVVFENDLKIRFGSNISPAYYSNKSYIVQGVGTGITLVAINNNVQLLKGIDYTFDQHRPAITIAGSVILDVDYRITIVEYSDTDGNYIPETPTKLGLYPRFTPAIIEDDTYRTTINVIVGHDGSKTPAFGDYRDTLLLELERRIYNNIKVDYDATVFGIYDVIPGRFRSGDYLLSEFDTILTQNFLTWVGNNTIDYSSNTTFQSNDGFTWNYSVFSDSLDGSKLQGSWRAIFKYFYDTETPHQTPWEMLGFSQRPMWWEDYYGPAPYTGDNALLWEHLAAGVIIDGARAGIDIRFARPGLLSVIPVDENGFLRSPVEFLTASFNSRNATSAWAIGNYGPVETAWRRSSDFPYAMQLAMALTKPARFFGSLIDTKNYNYNTTIEQYTFTSNNHHINQSDIIINGDVVNSVISRSAGYINWIADYLTNQGINPSIRLSSMISAYSVNLSYKMAGFTDAKYLQILAEQYSPTSTNDSIVIPNENYNIHLNKSTPVQKIIYSGVIVEKTNNGYSVRGYDLSNPYFTIIPSVVNSHATKIQVLNETATVFFDYQNLKIIVPYGYEFKSQQQLVDFLISYERFLNAQGFIFTQVDDVLAQVRNWQLSAKEFLYWIQQGWGIGSILVLSPVATSLDVLTSGAIVDGISDTITGSKIVDQNFKMVRNIEYNIMRSSTNFNITLTNNQMIGLVELNLVQYEHVLIFDNVTVFNDIIYKPELGNRQFRLKLIGQKTANWDGSLNAPGFIYSSANIIEWNTGTDYLTGELIQYKSQYYVALESVIASDRFDFSKWKQINYSSIKTGLLPNFASISNQGDTFYDNYNELVDSNNTYYGGTGSNLSHYSYGLIGFKPRLYLYGLGLTDTSQLELYKGFIKQKGTLNSLTALSTAYINDASGQINFYDEWAVRVGEYGAITSNPFVEVVLNEKIYATNVQTVEFVNAADNNLADGVTVFNERTLYKSSGQFDGTIAHNQDQYTNLENNIPYAGYVNVSDVDTTIFDLTSYVDLDNQISAMGSGYTIWCAKDFNGKWNVYRVTETNNTVTSISNALDGYISIACRSPHNLIATNIILIKNFNAIFDGFYQVHSVVNLSTILVQYFQSSANLTTVTGNGILYTLDSLRFDYMENVRLYNPPNGWKLGEKVWINTVVPDSQWGVYEKTHPWGLNSLVKKPISNYKTNDGYGHSIKLNDTGTVMAVGAPYNNLIAGSAGIVNIFVKTAKDTFDHSTIVTSHSLSTAAFGYSIDIVNDTLVVGAPASQGPAGLGGTKGQVHVFVRNVNSQQFELIQILRSENTNDNFGHVVSLSRDGRWLYVGSPNTGTVCVYGFNSAQYNQFGQLILQDTYAPIGITVPANQECSGDISSADPVTPINSITLDWFPENANSIIIKIAGLTFMPGLDYSVVDNVITFDATSVTWAEFVVILSAIFTINPIAAQDVLRDVHISQTQCFTLIDTLTGSNTVADQFGYAISASADGAQVGIGAPLASVNVNGATLTNAGIAYVYDRTIESFKSDGVTTTFTTTNVIKNVYRVLLDGIEIVDWIYTATIGAYTVEFDLSAIPTPGTIVTIETNTFKLLQELVGSDPQVNSRHGTSLTICSFTCAIYVGAPGYNVPTGLHGNPANAAVIPVVEKGVISNSGAVFKNHNQGRLYGTINGIKKLNPIVIIGESFCINDFEITFTGISTIIRNGAIVTQLTLSVPVSVMHGDTIVQPVPGSLVGATVTYVGADADSITVLDVVNFSGTAFVSTGTTIVLTTPLLPSRIVTCRVIGSLESVVSDINNADILGISAVVECYVAEEVYYKNDLTNNWFSTNAMQVTNAVLLDYLNSASTSSIKPPFGKFYRRNWIWFSEYGIEVTDLLFAAILNTQTYLRLNSDATTARNLMRILSGVGTPIADLGLDVFVQMQILTSPDNIRGEQFGTRVALHKGAHALVISSTYGSTIVTTTYDLQLTIFDGTSTNFKEAINSSGAAYIFELYDDPRDSVDLPGRYSYTQQLNPGVLSPLAPGDQFGQGTDIVGDYIVVTAPNDSTTLTSGGSIYLFQNFGRHQGWLEVSHYQPKVDVDTVSRAYLYDTYKNTKLETLQLLDPAKGRIVGQAEQEITYKTVIDPAIYNTGSRSTVNISGSNHWDSLQQYQVWWNLDQVRYIDYEQGSLPYRSANWGKVFPGSVINICEWTQSAFLPSQYVSNGGDGVPMYVDDSAYVSMLHIDKITGTIIDTYYYWVNNKSALTAINSSRTLPTLTIANLIENPLGQGVPFAAIISNSAISLYNISTYLSSSNTVLHLDYGKSSSNIIHSEYELLTNSANTTIPTKIINKLVDSLSGINEQQDSVPDPKLNISERYGISIRPRQTMFVDRLGALDAVVVFMNNLLLGILTTNLLNITALLYAADPLPDASTDVINRQWDARVPTYDALLEFETGYPVGYRVLVVNDSTQTGLWAIYVKTTNGSTLLNNNWQAQSVQAYRVSDYWYTVDWYGTLANGTPANSLLLNIDFVAPDYPTAQTLPYAVGDIIKILDDGKGNWSLYEIRQIGIYNEVNEFVIIGSQNGAIQVSRALSDFSIGELGFDNQQYDSNRYDQNPSIETRYLLTALFQAISNQAGTGFKQALSQIFFILVNYIFVEQPYVDWIFKTSFVKVLHQLRSLSQSPSYINDKQTYYESYIEEVKPYKTKIREYVLSYTSTDAYDSNITDFDLPPYYDRDLKISRSPSGEFPSKDEAIWQTYPYSDWYNNRTYAISSITVDNGGTGFTKIPTILIVSDTGTGATAHAIIDYDTGAITGIVVDSRGSGYASQVRVVINGNGTGAMATAVFDNKQVRAIATTMKFDRVAYTPSFPAWSPYTVYQAGNIMSYNGAAYQVITSYQYSNNGPDGLPVPGTMYGNGIGIKTPLSYWSTDTIDFTWLTPVTAGDLGTFGNSSAGAMDRISSYYMPGANMPAIDAVSYTIMQATGTWQSDTIVLESTNEAGYYIDTVKYLKPGMFISGPGVVSAKIINVIGDRVNLINSIQVDAIQNISTSTEITASYTDMSKLVTGLTYPGTQLTGVVFEDSPGFDIGSSFGRAGFDTGHFGEGGLPQLDNTTFDTIISSDYLDSKLGTRAEDINVDGGSFVDTYSSYAPEELIPGIMFDTLNIQVHTEVSGNVLAYRVVNNMANETSYLRISSAYQTSLYANLGMFDTTISVVDATKLPSTNRQLGIPGVVFIGGERITYYRNYAQEVISWVPDIMFTADTIVSYRHIITFSSDISANIGNYILQESTGANALVVSSITSSVQAVIPVNNIPFTAGKFSIVEFIAGNVNILAIDANVSSISTFGTGYYTITSDITAQSFPFVQAQMLLHNNINVLGQIRRGTDGTGVPATHLQGELVVDASLLQQIPNSALTNVASDYTVLVNVAEKSSFILELEGNITANAGDSITQDFMSQANAYVLVSVVNSNRVLVNLNTTNPYDMLAYFTIGNIANAGYGLFVNGVIASDAYPVSFMQAGYQPPLGVSQPQHYPVIDPIGDTILPAGVSLITDRVWNKPGYNHATDGAGFGSGVASTWTEQESFLWNSPYQ